MPFECPGSTLFGIIPVRQDPRLAWLLLLLTSNSSLLVFVTQVWNLGTDGPTQSNFKKPQGWRGLAERRYDTPIDLLYLLSIEIALVYEVKTGLVLRHRDRVDHI